jgi:hypothetical protein
MKTQPKNEEAAMQMIKKSRTCLSNNRIFHQYPEIVFAFSVCAVTFLKAPTPLWLVEHISHLYILFTCLSYCLAKTYK